MVYIFKPFLIVDSTFTVYSLYLALALNIRECLCERIATYVQVFIETPTPTPEHES